MLGQLSWALSVPPVLGNGHNLDCHAHPVPDLLSGDRGALQQPWGVRSWGEEREHWCFTWCPRREGALPLCTGLRKMCLCTGTRKVPGLFVFSSLIPSAELLGHPKRSEVSGFATATAHPQKADVGKEARFSQRWKVNAMTFFGDNILLHN